MIKKLDLEADGNTMVWYNKTWSVLTALTEFKVTNMDGITNIKHCFSILGTLANRFVTSLINILDQLLWFYGPQ